MNLNVILRLSERCNMDCAYCYVDKEARFLSRHVLPLSMIGNLYFLISDSGCFDRLELIVHGGEALLTGYPYLHEVFERQSPLHERISVRNSIQTNATLIDAKMARLFRDYDVAVGVSIDAPSDVHDELRRTWGNKPTLDATLRGVAFLQSAGVDVAANCVLSKRNLNRIPEIYDYFSRLGVPFKLSPCYEAEDTPPSLEGLKVSPEEYGEAICQLLDIYLADRNPTTQIEDLDDVISSFYGGCGGNCMFAGRCHEFIGVSPKGDVFLCDFFYQDDFRIGNLASMTPDLLIHNPVSDRIRTRQTARPTKCRSCEWWDVCRGGCPSVAFSAWGDAFREDHFCQSRIRLFTEVRDRLAATAKVPTVWQESECLRNGQQKYVRIEKEIA